MKERPILFSGPMVRAILDGTKTQTRRVMKQPPPPFVQQTPDKHPPKHPEPYIDAYCGERKSVSNPRGMGDEWCWWTRDNRPGSPFARCPYGHPGDQLWVRESWRTGVGLDRKTAADIAVMCGEANYDRPWAAIEYKDGQRVDWDEHVWGVPGRWRSSRFMPRWASRISLEIENVRIERLQDISNEDVLAEGIEAITKDGGRTVKYGVPDNDGLPGTDNTGWPWSDWTSTPQQAFARLWDQINAKSGLSYETNPWVWALTFRRVECAT